MTRKTAGANLSTGVGEWYTDNFPTDELGYEINPSVDFGDVLDMMADGIDFYDIVGVGDSLVRERVFEGCAEAWGWTYDEVYVFWLHGTLPLDLVSSKARKTREAQNKGEEMAVKPSGIRRKGAKQLVDVDEVEDYVYYCDFFSTGGDMPLSYNELCAVADKAEEYLIENLQELDWFHSLFDDCISDALYDVAGQHVESTRKRAYDEVEFWWGNARVLAKGTDDGVEWSVDTGDEYEDGTSHGADEAAQEIADFLSSLPNYQDVTQGDILDEMDYYDLEARRTRKSASAKKATRKFTYAEIKELEDEIEGKELRNTDRLKDAAVCLA